MYGNSCDTDQEHALCEFESCYTVEGQLCKFPFKYKVISNKKVLSRFLKPFLPKLTTSFKMFNEKIDEKFLKEYQHLYLIKLKIIRINLTIK